MTAFDADPRTVAWVKSECDRDFALDGFPWQGEPAVRYVLVCEEPDGCGGLRRVVGCAAADLAALEHEDAYEWNSGVPAFVVDLSEPPGRCVWWVRLPVRVRVEAGPQDASLVGFDPEEEAAGIYHEGGRT